MAFRDQVESPSCPAVATEAPTTIVNGVTMTSTFQASSVVDVSSARQITLLIDFDAGGAGNIPDIIPLFSADNAQPAATDDSWFAPNETDGSITAATVGGTGLSGADFTLQPEYANVTARPLLLRLETSDAASDEYRLAVTLRCDWARYFHCQFADSSGTTLGALTVKICRSV